ncbi:MAG: hypothetical protein EOP45_13000 [Sphingobacteriaceae bacterium]|nr:MAG: hypothetical protein EOP45_13000 [Sphingobacteriaceae bacterium]
MDQSKRTRIYLKGSVPDENLESSFKSAIEAVQFISCHSKVIKLDRNKECHIWLENLNQQFKMQQTAIQLLNTIADEWEDSVFIREAGFVLSIASVECEEQYFFSENFNSGDDAASTPTKKLKIHNETKTTKETSAKTPFCV